MVDQDQTGERQSAQQQAGGGRSSRGPEYGTGGGEVQVSVPPYDDLRGENTGEGAEGVRKSFDADNAPEPGPALPITDEEREGMSGTEMEPEPALGVGESQSRGGEEIAPDRDDVGTKGPSQRPVGKVAGGDDTEGPRDPKSPDLQTGDQGG